MFDDGEPSMSISKLAVSNCPTVTMDRPDQSSWRRSTLEGLVAIRSSWEQELFRNILAEVERILGGEGRGYFRNRQSAPHFLQQSRRT